MRQASIKKDRLPLAPPMLRLLREALLYVLAALALYLLVALATYHQSDSSWTHVGSSGLTRNAGGRAGAWLSDALYAGFGYLALLFPMMLAFAAWRAVRAQERIADRLTRGLVVSGLVLTLVGGCGLADLAMVHNPWALPFSSGGLLGHVVGRVLVHTFSNVGASIFLLAVFLAGITLFTQLSWLAVMDRIGGAVFTAGAWLRSHAGTMVDRVVGRKARARRREVVAQEKKVLDEHPAPRIEPIVRPEVSVRAERERQVPLFKAPLVPGELPPLALLDPPDPPKTSFTGQTLP
ncbi:MAG TPA: DNA translocase FtsK 4TM domain-containing protein, partial [Acidiferrobacteraceae bacterium]|nr:DNA translocase FtsK 4TM domain-containing protein [Acidiferrobacteraceae bacterium]